jgi:Ca-activated chloride channel family protein
LILLEGEWVTEPQRRAFREFADFTRSPAGQRLVLQEGYRPADLQVPLNDPASLVRPENGADPAQPYTLLPLPGPSVVDQVSELWAVLKRPANIYLVADVSGSMGEGDRITRAREALLSFVAQIRSEQERVGLITFSNSTEEIVRMDALGTNRTALNAAIEGLRPGGETALHDAALFAVERLAARRDTERINVVLLMTDGQENASRRASKNPDQLVNQLRAASTGKGVPVLLFAVGYAGGADQGSLQRIAQGAGGQAFPSDPATIRRLYQKLSSYF